MTKKRSMTISVPTSLYAELLAYQSKQTATTGRKPTNGEVISAALTAYLKRPITPTPDFGEASFEEEESWQPPSVETMVTHTPEPDPDYTPSYEVTKRMDIRAQLSPQEKLSHFKGLLERAANGELGEDPDAMDE